MVAPERIGRYEIDGVLGAGGFATVYAAVDPMLDAHVAVKVLAENWCLDPDVRSRFVQEAQIMWRSDDDHIVRVHTVGETDEGRPYFVMQLADRGSLADRLTAAGAGGLPPGEAIGIAARLADAVDVIHRLGFVHRDLKPSNVLFRSRRAHEDGDGDVLMLADLGLAKALSDASGLASSVGTRAYMAPEQADPSRGADERSDVYSLGVITYELLTGAVPAEGVDARAALGAISGLAPSTVDTVTSALEPRGDRRPPSAAAFRDGLGASTRVAETSPVSGGSMGTARRRRWILASAGAAAVLAGAIVWASTRPEGRHVALTTLGSHASTSATAPSTKPRGHSATTTRGHPPTTKLRVRPATTVAPTVGQTSPQVTDAPTIPVAPIVTAPPITPTSSVVTVKPPPPTVQLEQRTIVKRGVESTWRVTATNARHGTWSLKSGSTAYHLRDPSWLPGNHFDAPKDSLDIATYVLTLTVYNSAGESARASVTFRVVA